MLRAFVKNTFLALEEPEEAMMRREVTGSSGRSKSAPASASTDFEHASRASGGQVEVEHLSRILSLSFSREARSRVPQTPPKQEQAQQPQAPIRAAQLGQERRAFVATKGRQSLRAAAEKPGTPSVDELRRLQRRLSEVTGLASKVPLAKLGQQRVMSNSSVSTMVSDCEDTTGKSPIQKVWSSGSVSTMVSDLWDDHEEGGIEFGPIFEEETLSSQSPQPQAVQEGAPWVAGDLKSEGSPLHMRSMPKDFSHSRVPKSLNLAEEFSKCSNEEPPTTMMIRNIPNRYTQRELIRELEGLGFGGTFDFLYVPIDKGTMCNVGYAFVNFTDSQWAEKCMQSFENYSFKKHRKARGKIASVSVAHIQGLEANVKHYENSAVNGATRSRQRGPVIMPSIAQAIGEPQP